VLRTAARAACIKYPASGIMLPEACSAVSLKNPDAVAAIVAALRHVYGDEVARLMLVEGMSLADLIDAMFSAPMTHREAVRAITDGLDDFVISPDLGRMWHLKYVYGDQPGSLHVMDMEIATPNGVLASTDVLLRLSS
jgi:hypothetical protein